MRRAPILVVALVSGRGAVPAWAGPEEDIFALTARWGDLFAGSDPEKLTALYADDAVVWGTVSRILRQGRTEVLAHWTSTFEVLPSRKVEFGIQEIRIYGDTAIDTGTYRFSFVRDGHPRTLLARFSLVFVKTAEGWRIVDHHSSEMPPRRASLPAESKLPASPASPAQP